MARYSSLSQLRRFETVQSSVEENYTRAKYLLMSGGKDNIDLAERLISCCEMNAPCESFACKLCNRRFRLRKVDEIVDKMREGKNKWWSVTLLDYSRAFGRSELQHFDLKKSKDRLRKLLKRSGFSGPILGSIEIDFHESCQLWLPHFHLVIPINKENRIAKKVISKKLKLLQPHHIKVDRIARPSKFMRIKNPYTQVSYVYKLAFFRVIDRKCKYSGKIFTSKYRLEGELFCDSLRWMDAQGRRRVLFSYDERGW
ncbi:hypothetical protein ACXLRA_002714 [Vibrio vulnificus]|nr:hypothetical protein [Vibrio vulnificus]HDY7473120.1 hypothetical protein [Vibrio vulnificus]HDY7475243.1 hypothetical protein [Vibrio vulnificus]